jgi:hypothetical protein
MEWCEYAGTSALERMSKHVAAASFLWYAAACVAAAALGGSICTTLYTTDRADVD